MNLQHRIAQTEPPFSICPRRPKINRNQGFLLLWLALALCSISLRAAELSPRVKIGTTWLEPIEEITPTPGEINGLQLPYSGRLNPDLGDWPATAETWLIRHPGSSYRPSVLKALGRFYKDTGGFTRSLACLEEGWTLTKNSSGGSGKEIGDYCLAYYTRMLASLGREEELGRLLSETKMRVLDHGPLSQMFARTREAYIQMRSNPGYSFKCGTFALAHLSQRLGHEEFMRSLLAVPSPRSGFSLEFLANLPETRAMNLVAARRTSGSAIIVPCVVHWQQNHYAAIVVQQGEMFLVVDPTFERPRWVSRRTINTEASGYFLVPSTKMTGEFTEATAREAQLVSGRGNPNFMGDPNDIPCKDCPTCPVGTNERGNREGIQADLGESGTCKECSTTAAGMAIWRVSEPYINLWIEDEPLGYQPALGERISFKLRYKQRAEADDGAFQTYFGFGRNWTSEWFGFIDCTDFQRYGFSLTVIPPNGGFFDYDPSNGTVQTNYYNNARMSLTTNLSGEPLSFTIAYPNGATNIFDARHTNSSGDIDKLFLSRTINHSGQAVLFLYEHYNTADPNSVMRLQYVVDADGMTNSISYFTSGFSTNLVQSVTDRYGRVATLAYDSSGQLSNIVDVAGLASGFRYNSYGWPTNLVTAYGTTYFNPVDKGLALNDILNLDRAITITEPSGAHELYAFRQEACKVPASYPSSEVPTNTPVATLEGNLSTFARVNSFYWNRRQYSMLSGTFTNSGDLYDLTTNDCKLARMRHWLGGSSHPPITPIDTISMEREGSPDGVTEGQKVWFDYVGKPAHDWRGTEILPAVVALVLPDGSTRYTYFQRNEWGLLTNQVETFTGPAGEVALRTNAIIRATTGIDIITQKGADGTLKAGFSYTAAWLPLVITNSTGGLTSYTYDGSGRVTSVIYPSGLIRTNVLLSSGPEIGRTTKIIELVDTGVNSTNEFTYTNGLVFSTIDPRGLCSTNSWDALQRLVGVSYPDGTTVSNVYARLDKVAVKDRLGNWTRYSYDSLGLLIAITNANSQVTYLSRCSCGLLDAKTDPLGHSTSHFYDLLGRETNVVFGDGSVLNRTFNSLGQLTVLSDGASSVTNTYNNQGLLTTSSNAFGRVQLQQYDIMDRPTNSMTAEGVLITREFDAKGRPTGRGHADGGFERYVYSERGMIAYTNQLGAVRQFTLDSAGRCLYETNELGGVSAFIYNFAGDLTGFSDPNGQWTYVKRDLYGRQTEKTNANNVLVTQFAYNASGFVTNRWTLGKGNTVYQFSSMGQLTNVSYPVSPQILLSYDAVGRLTNMVDGVGSTKFSYSAANQLISEDGPWADDSITLSYNRRLRSAMVLAEPVGNAVTNEYRYDTANRLTNQTSSIAGTFLFQYSSGVSGAVSASRRVTRISEPNGAFITNSYNQDGMVAGTSLMTGGGTLLDGYSYGYNIGGAVTNALRVGESFLAFSHDKRGQITESLGFDTNGSVRLHETMRYSYDGAGNLSLRTNNDYQEFFAYNTLNQMTGSSNAGTLTVAGITTGGATNVTINDLAATRYLDNSFARAGFSFSNGNNLYVAKAQDAVSHLTTDSISVLVPSQSLFQYDGNGNLVSDGLKGFEYDDENELIRIVSTNSWKSEFVYDGVFRRRISREFLWQSGAWVQFSEIRYIYDGDVVVEERDANNRPLVTYTRGVDYGGRLAKNSGVGGMLGRTERVGGATAYYHCDGNGNITALVGSNQLLLAKYIYDPFGNVVTARGPLADENKYRFSSKEVHSSSGLYYYGYRFFDPRLQRWLNQDPIAEAGGRNLYTFSGNDPVDLVDRDGHIFGALLLLAEKIAAAALKACPSIKCKEPCEDCCLIAWTAGNAALQIAFVEELPQCVGLGLPWAQAACVAITASTFVIDTALLASDYSECTEKCSKKPTVRPPTCCKD